MGHVVDDLATYAQAQSVGTIGTDLFRFNLTSDPDAQLAIVPYTGRPGEQAFGSDALKWERPRVQVASRGPKGDHRTAYEKAVLAYKAFGKIAAETLSGTFYHSATCLQAPFFKETDLNGRPIYIFNVELEKEVGI